MEKIREIFKQEFETFPFRTTAFEDQWIEFIQDLISFSETFSDGNYIRYKAVFTKQEWNEFKNHPQRLPYESKNTYLPLDLDQRYKYYLKVIKSSIDLWKETTDERFKQKLKLFTSSLFSGAIGEKYDLEIMRLADEYVGRSIEERDNGDINPTEFQQKRFDYAIKEYSRFYKEDYKKVKKEIWDICNGRISILIEYFYTCQIPLELDIKLRKIFEILKKDRTLTYTEIQLGWEQWKEVREYLGVNLDFILEFENYPNYVTIKERLESFLNNREFNEEIIQHLKDEFPESYKRFKRDGFIEYEEIQREEAKIKNYPYKLRSEKEVAKMIKESEEIVFKFFPLVKHPSPKNVILNPTHPESTSRAFQSSTLNKFEDKVNVICMSPRTSDKDDYLRTLAHEEGHALHRIILEKGEKAGILEKGAAQSVTGSVMEVFSMLVESQFHKDSLRTSPKKFKGSEFSSFLNGFVVRHQAPFGLVEITLRKIFDELYDKGQRDPLSLEQIIEIENNLDEDLKKWYYGGIKILRKNMRAFDLFRVERLDDGLVYMKKYVVKKEVKPVESDENTEEKQGSDLEKTFVYKFGEKWVENQDARAMVLWLMLESGRNQKSEGYDEFVKNKSINECYAELEKIGIKRDEI